MKKPTNLCSLILAACLALLCTCGDGAGESASIRISMGGIPSQGRAAVGIDQLQHTITLSGPTGVKTVSIAGAGTASVAVAPGTWDISVQGYYGEELYSVGSASAEVRAGRSTSVSVQMTVVWSDPDEAVGPPPTYTIAMDPSGSVSISAGIDYPVSPVVTVTISNTGTKATGPLDVNVDNALEFDLSGSIISTIAPGRTGTFDVVPVLGLALGTYAATVTVSSATNGINASFDLVFTVEPIMVTFDSNGGTAVSPITALTYGDTIVAPTPPTRDVPGWYSFDAWYKEASLTNVWTFATDTVTGETTLYAKWIPLKSVGDTGPGGGLIFYVDPAGFTVEGDSHLTHSTYPGSFDSYTAHYLEAAPADETQSTWGLQTELTGATGGAIGTGRRNTTLIVQKLDDWGDAAINSRAAKICYDKIEGGFDDWFLPSTLEIEQMRTNLFLNGWGGFNTTSYFTSRETAAYQASTYTISTGIAGNALKNSPPGCNVRAARAF